MKKIYVGRWDLLPEEWEGYNGLVEKNRDEIFKEICREMEVYEKANPIVDWFMGVYIPEEFENTFNGDLVGAFNNEKYWIRIF